MHRARFMLALTMFVGAALTFAPAAMARADGGQGFFGESTDKSITLTLFGVIALCPVVIATRSLIQWRLDKRKHAKMDAYKRRAANADWRGGW